MPRFDAVTRSHVLSALAEYDRLGSETFLGTYGFRSARDYFLWHDGRSYDSKAVLGVALKYATGVVARSDDFSGGKDGAAKVLVELGFDVRTTSSADVVATSVGSERPPGTKPFGTAGEQRVCPTCHLQLLANGTCGTCE